MINITEEQINRMADRFCGWKLPEAFNPDGGVTFTKTFGNHTYEPTGTNVFTHEQAKEMIRYMIEGLE